jgi:pullulanase
MPARWRALHLLILACLGPAACLAGQAAEVHGGATPIRLDEARAVWLDAGTIAWPGADGAPGADAQHSYRLYYSARAALAPAPNGLAGADHPAGEALAPVTLSHAQLARFPQYRANTLALRVPAALRARLREVLRSQLAIVQFAGATPAAGTTVQLAPVLDDLYAGAAASLPLGLSFGAAGAPTFRLWAPTAQRVRLHVYDSATGGPGTTLEMQREAASGTWRFVAKDARWVNRAWYTYEVTVWSRHANDAGGGAIVTNAVTDPNSVLLSGNSLRSMVLDLRSAATKPAGWPGRLLPTAAVPTDGVLYELHLRDFSIDDATVPAAHRGKYLAFTDLQSGGMRHLAALAAAGLTHLHLLPVFDIASVDELHCTTPAIAPATGASAGPAQQVQATQAGDCYNWGYDPLHYGAPEGSYASDPDDGLARVLEFRRMVAALHAVGLRLVMDVVYNHDTAHGQVPTAVLDRIVPDYYHRLDARGATETHSCCSDTATEHAMMARLMRDTLVSWADAYKVDGFRFDLMGMTSKESMLAARAAVEAVAAADGRGHTLFYGEGWTPDAEAAAVMTPATQAGMAGTGIGSFNDRLRDAVRGGRPFDTGAAMVANQGFINGLCVDANAIASALAQARCSGEAEAMQAGQDAIRVGLAGGLAAFHLRPGTLGAQAGGYTQRPEENVAYVAAHDNETLFDVSQYKHPAGTATADVARAQVVGLSLALLAQGLPFVHAGDELLRSKSGDSNSFDSGDWFNRIDWSGNTNHWATGLPPGNTGNNAANAATLAPILASRPAPTAADIHATDSATREFIAIRRDTDFFRLQSAEAVIACVGFPDATAQVAGLIVERIASDCGGFRSHTPYRSVVALYNAAPVARSFVIAAYAGRMRGSASGQVALHPLQLTGSDARLKAGWGFSADAQGGTFTVPARSTAVFVEWR